jgi:hypothetical protein
MSFVESGRMFNDSIFGSTLMVGSSMDSFGLVDVTVG